MNILKTLSIGIFTATTLFAQTTMCFKENHTSMMTIESTALDGGLCSSNKSVQDMKNDGWSVDDIKIEKSSDGNNYIYIFKKNETNLSSINEEKLEQKILQKLETRKKEESAAKKTAIKMRMSRDGKNLYIKKCQNCHGEKANEKYGPSRALTELNFMDFKTKSFDNGSFKKNWLRFSKWVSSRDASFGKSSMWQSLIKDFDLYRNGEFNEDNGDSVDYNRGRLQVEYKF